MPKIVGYIAAGIAVLCLGMFVLVISAAVLGTAIYYDQQNPSNEGGSGSVIIDTPAVNVDADWSDPAIGGEPTVYSPATPCIGPNCPY